MDQNFLTQSDSNYDVMPQIENPDDSASLILGISCLQEADNKVEIRDTQIQPQKSHKIISKVSMSSLRLKRKTYLKKTKTQKRNKTKKNVIGSDYKKNICGYVTKKIMRQFVGEDYSEKVEELCQSQNIDYESTTSFYQPKIERVTGPSHLPALMTPSTPKQKSMMRAFIKFFKWFLEERYVRHIFVEGKMELKRVYIQYKNRELLPLIRQFETKFWEESDSTMQVHGSSDLSVVGE